MKDKLYSIYRELKFSLSIKYSRMQLSNINNYDFVAGYSKAIEDILSELDKLYLQIRYSDEKV